MQMPSRSLRLALLTALSLLGCGINIDPDDDKNAAAGGSGGPPTEEVSESLVRAELRGGDHARLASAEVVVGRIELLGDQDVVLTEEGGKFDLLDLDGEVTELLAEAEVEMGCYKQLRLVVESAEVTLKEGFTFTDGSRTKDLDVPSGASSGIKVDLSSDDPDLKCEGGGRGVELNTTETRLTVTMDPAKNFVVQGDCCVRDVTFTPHLKCFVSATGEPAPPEEDDDEILPGYIQGHASIEGDESLDLEGIVVRAQAVESELPPEQQTPMVEGMLDANGGYILKAAPGQYEVMIEAPEGWQVEPEMREVTVESESIATDVDFVLSPIPAPPEEQGTLVGRLILDVDVDVNLEGREVRCERDDGETFTARLDAEMRFTMDLDPGTYRVSIDLPAGLELRTQTVEIRSGETTEVTWEVHVDIDVIGR